MHHLDRRDFLAAVLGGAGLLANSPLGAVERLARAIDAAPGDAAPGDAAPDGAASEPAAQPAARLRRNVYCMNASTPAIVAYKKAVETMRARPASDPTSWAAQANIHGANAPVAGMLADLCEHSNVGTNTFFLSWHRMYLYHFERIVRAASGDPNFSLPYWGYAPGAAGTRVLPAPFRLPADATNPLYTSQRRATINAGSAITASAVDAGTALGNVAFGSWSGAVEGTPHGQVHTAVGGPGGWMSAFETAGLDPIFWLHHCNVDRLWELWLAQGGGRANPSSGPWATQSFQFYTETGATVSMTGAQVVDTAAQLSYRYAGPSCLTIVFPRDWWKYVTLVRPWDPVVVAALQRIRDRPPLPQPRPIARAQQPVTLGASPAALRLPLDAAARRALDAVADPAGPAGAGGQLTLVLDDVRLAQGPAVVYEIYLGLPAGERAAHTSPHYVGNLNLFGPAKRDRPLRQALPLLPTLLRLRALQRAGGDALAVTFVPRGATEDERPEALLRGRPQATIGRVEVRVE